jgi:hypothetical protein
MPGRLLAYGGAAFEVLEMIGSSRIDPARTALTAAPRPFGCARTTTAASATRGRVSAPTGPRPRRRSRSRPGRTGGMRTAMIPVTRATVGSCVAIAAMRPATAR